MGVLAGLSDVIAANAASLRIPGVLAVRPGFLAGDGGWPTTARAIVVVKARGALDPAVPSQIAGIPVQIREADPLEQFAADSPEEHGAIALTRPEARLDAFEPPETFEASIPDVLAAKPQLPYEPPAGVSLTPVTGTSAFTVHASPDAGWPVLKAFLAGTKRELVIGLYDFTSKHILDAADAALLGGKKLTITLDNPAPNPTRDQLDIDTLKSLRADLGVDLKAAWALDRMNSGVLKWIYPSAYHIKVAVRDGDTVWLSSGNWNNSNQPDFDPIGDPQPSDQETARQSDRDWHVVIEDAALAGQFRAYLLNDYDVASRTAQEGDAPVVAGAAPQPALPDLFSRRAAAFSFHPPQRIAGERSTITPLLTPDPGLYRDAMLALIESVETSLYIQLQYIHPSNNTVVDEKFNALLDAVAAKIDAGKDVRIILSQWQVPGGWLDRLQDAGIALENVRIQQGVHNKGFVIDRKIVALGSQNWSGDGVLRNRDASVIIDNVKAAEYFTTIFLHDWENLARQQA
jgi:phosphatidylserine/phosphatidylglycerophosphate/cardiolipin synthase-like enzyme